VSEPLINRLEYETFPTKKEKRKGRYGIAKKKRGGF
jgi:hypothetical protein